MGENSKIEWTDHTFNPWMGCTKVSEACRNCYAERDMDHRYGKVAWGPKGTRVVTTDANWRKPIQWNKQAQETGIRTRVFCASLADVFEGWQGPMFGTTGEPLHHAKAWGVKDKTYIEVNGLHIGKSIITMQDVRNRLFALIDATPHLDWLLLTKRPENIRRMWPVIQDQRPIFPGMPGPLGESSPCIVPSGKRDNVWLGTSVENQEAADTRIPELLKCRDLSPVLFLSCEPLLGPLDLEQTSHTVSPGYFGNAFNAIHWPGTPEEIRSLPPYPRIDWVIAGGESGPNARPMHPDWVRGLRDQCVAAGVPFHFKQWGEFIPLIGEQKGGRWDGAKISESGVSTPILPFKKNGYTGYEYVDGQVCMKVGKKYSGRMLDGMEWNQFPKVEAV